MTHGTLLSEKRSQILNLRLKGETIRSISLKLNHNKCTINNFLKNSKEYGKVKHFGQPLTFYDR